MENTNANDEVIDGDDGKSLSQLLLQLAGVKFCPRNSLQQFVHHRLFL